MRPTFSISLPLPPFLLFQHSMDYVHIAIVFITMLEIVLSLDNFLIILMSIRTYRSLDQGMILIFITHLGATL
jgi:predicted tellurium resistance membrane protein TerC